MREPAGATEKNKNKNKKKQQKKDTHTVANWI